MAFRSSSSTTFTGATALTATAPAGVSAGDRLESQVTQDGNGHALSAATGWTKIGTDITQNTPDTQQAAIFERKVATGSDSYNFTSEGTQSAIVQVVALTGRHATTAAVIASTNSDTGNATPIAVSMTGVTASAGDDIVVFCELNHSVQTDTWASSAPSGYTERQDVSPGDWITASTNTRDAVTAGATGAITSTATRATGTGTAGYGGWVVAVPATDAPGPPNRAAKRLPHPALLDPPLETRSLLDVRDWP